MPNQKKNALTALFGVLLHLNSLSGYLDGVFVLFPEDFTRDLFLNQSQLRAENSIVAKVLRIPLK